MVLSKFLGGGKANKDQAKTDPAPEEAFALYPPRSPSGLNPLDFGDFAARIQAFRKAHIEQPDYKVMGCLQIFDLERVRHRFGRRWPSIKEKAYKIVESALHKRLGTDDIYVASGESEIYVLTTGLDRPEAERRGFMIASDITSRLCGTVPGGNAIAVKDLPFDFGDGLDGITSFRQLVKRIEAYGRSVDGAELELFNNHADRIRMRYRPTVALQNQIIGTYQGEPMLEDIGDILLPVDTLCPRSINGMFDAEIDNWALQQVTTRLEQITDEADPARISAPLHYETLATMRFRESYVEYCKRLPECSSSFLDLEVVGIPPSVPQARVRELVAYIKPFCNDIIARVPNDALFAEHLGNCSIGVLSCDLGAADPEAAATRTQIETLAQIAHENDMQAFVCNTWSVALSHIAFKAGIELLNGDAFIPSSDRPGSIVNLKKD